MSTPPRQIRRRARTATRCVLLLLVASTGWVLPAQAHRLAPSLLTLESAGEGQYDVLFKTPSQRPTGVEIVPALPDHCAPLSQPEFSTEATGIVLRWRVDCGTSGLVGSTLAVRGLAESGTNALIRVVLPQGRRVQAVLHADADELVVPERPSAWRVFQDYLWLGAEHIAGGFDHLLFVFGLLLLANGARSLVATVTAFTLGHSVTLSLAALGFVRFPSAPIEVIIALTILVLALELARTPPKDDALLRQRPWAVSFGFGLLHGFGFAGALSEVGLPEAEIPMALFSFNVGIEIGQLVFVGVVLTLGWLFARVWKEWPPWLLRVPVMAMGGLAFYWCLDRGLGLFAGGF
ncbi:MAG: HupE/UreJ family protein [Myxococcota bacterium]